MSSGIPLPKCGIAPSRNEGKSPDTPPLPKITHSTVYGATANAVTLPPPPMSEMVSDAVETLKQTVLSSHSMSARLIKDGWLTHLERVFDRLAMMSRSIPHTFKRSSYSQLLTDEVENEVFKEPEED